MEPRTLNDIFFRIVERRQEQLMLVRGATSWLPASSQEFYRNVAGVARALTSWGISKGDRVAILSENRQEWAIADFACFLLGAAVVPIYSTLTAEQSAYILCDSGARVIFLSTASQLQKVLSIQGQTAVERIVVMDAIGGSDAICMKQLMNKGPSGRDPELERVARNIRPDDLASIIYTSGTTGRSAGTPDAPLASEAAGLSAGVPGCRETHAHRGGRGWTVPESMTWMSWPGSWQRGCWSRRTWSVPRR